MNPSDAVFLLLGNNDSRLKDITPVDTTPTETTPTEQDKGWGLRMLESYADQRGDKAIIPALLQGALNTPGYQDKQDEYSFRKQSRADELEQNKVKLNLLNLQGEAAGYKNRALKVDADIAERMQGEAERRIRNEADRSEAAAEKEKADAERLKAISQLTKYDAADKIYKADEARVKEISDNATNQQIMDLPQIAQAEFKSTPEYKEYVKIQQGMLMNKINPEGFSRWTEDNNITRDDKGVWYDNGKPVGKDIDAYLKSVSDNFNNAKKVYTTLANANGNTAAYAVRKSINGPMGNGTTNTTYKDVWGDDVTAYNALQSVLSSASAIEKCNYYLYNAWDAIWADGKLTDQEKAEFAQQMQFLGKKAGYEYIPSQDGASKGTIVISNTGESVDADKFFDALKANDKIAKTYTEITAAESARKQLARAIEMAKAFGRENWQDAYSMFPAVGGNSGTNNDSTGELIKTYGSKVSTASPGQKEVLTYADNEVNRLEAKFIEENKGAPLSIPQLRELENAWNVLLENGNVNADEFKFKYLVPLRSAEIQDIAGSLSNVSKEIASNMKDKKDKSNEGKRAQVKRLDEADKLRNAILWRLDEMRKTGHKDIADRLEKMDVGKGKLITLLNFTKNLSGTSGIWRTDFGNYRSEVERPNSTELRATPGFPYKWHR